jgi:signal transduction histidine kinase
LPMTVKVPLLVAALMLAVSAALTDRVLNRLESTQEAHLRQLANAYMDGLSALVSPHVLHHDTWEVFDGLERAAGSYHGLELMWTTVVTPSGAIVASSMPVAFPVDSQMSAPLSDRFEANAEFILVEGEGRAHLRRVLDYQGRTIGAIYADVDISRLLGERREVLAALLLTNALLTFVLATLGYLVVRWMMNPIKILSRYLGRARTGGVEPIPPHLVTAPGSEFGRLFAHYNEMAAAIAERESLTTRLAEEEKLASLGRLASGIAHEINNPLGGLFNAIDSLRRHGDKEAVRSTSISLLERGLSGIRDVVRATLHVYRADRNLRQLTAQDIEDLALLVRPEVKRKRIQFEWNCGFHGSVPADAASIRDIALNLLLNACAATPVGGRVEFSVSRTSEALELRFVDEGSGFPESAKIYIESADAGRAPIEERAGLGLWIVRRLADELNAIVTVAAHERGGTIVRVNIPLLKAERLSSVA